MHKDPDHIKHEIEQLQARLKERFENVGNRLSPNTLVNETVGRVVSDPMRSLDQAVAYARNNPIASSLLAAGAMALLGTVSRDRVATQYAGSKAERRVSETSANAKAKARTIAKTSRQTADQISEAVATKADEITTGARRQVVKANNEIADIYKNASEKTRNLSSDAKRFAEDNPVALGLFAVGIGALAASMFTARRSEKSDDASKTTPAVRQAKKATRSKSSPNNTVRRMKPATTGSASKKTSVESRTASQKNASPAAGGNEATTKKKRVGKPAKSSRSTSVEAKLNESSKK